MFNKKGETNKAHDTHKDRGERKRKSILIRVKKQTQDKKQKASGAAAAEK